MKLTIQYTNVAGYIHDFTYYAMSMTHVVFLQVIAKERILEIKSYK